MMDALTRLWRERTPREQRLLLVMVGLLLAVALWLGILRPLSLALAAQTERHAEAVVALAELRAAAADLERLGAGGGPARDVPLATLLGRRAEEAGISLARLEGEGRDRANLDVAAVRAPAFFGWLQQLEQRDGLVVRRLDARRNEDGSLAVQLALEGAAP